MTLYTLLFSGLCVIGGVVVALVRPGDAIAMVLLGMAGAGGVGVGVLAKHSEAQHRERADKQQQRADQLFEETQTLRRQR